MKTKLFLLGIVCSISSIVFGQQIGNGYATTLNQNGFNTKLLTGNYVTENTQDGYPSISWPYNWRYLLNLNSYTYNDGASTASQFQISTAYVNDDRVFFRKLYPYSSTSGIWNEFATRGENTFVGTQRIDGTLVAKEIKVQTNIWADFVFAKDYQLPTLAEVKVHIDEHKHLPGIPSETEVKENGVSLADMTSKLLQKVEELTLYAIQQQETINTLNNKVQELENSKK